MSRHASELCATLVDDIYGELTSLLLKILLIYKRLSTRALEHHTCLSPRLIKHGLSVLVQHQLVLWYTSGNNSTIYEANTTSAYALVRSGKYVKIAEDQNGEFGGEVISSLLSLGHAQVGDLLEGFGVGTKIHTDGSLAPLDIPEKMHSNGWKHANDNTAGHSVTFESIQATLCDLLRAGFISVVHESHFRSEADNRLEAEKVVPPPEYYKAKSKRENDAQWEASIKKKLADWSHGMEIQVLETDVLRKGNKRPLEDPEEFQAKKRLSLGTQKVNGVKEAAYVLKTGETGFLDDEITLRINHAKFDVALRNDHLIELAEQVICTSTSRVYAEILRAIQPRVLKCVDEADTCNDSDAKPDLSFLPQISTDEVVTFFQDSADLASALGKVDVSRKAVAHFDHRKKRRKKEANSEDDAMEDGNAGSDEDEEDSSEDNASNTSSDSDEVDDQTDYTSKSFPQDITQNAHREAIRDHLQLLARHPLGFLHHFPQTAVLPERWSVDFPTLMKNVRQHTLMQNITCRHGMLATRVVRILIEEGKVGEKELCAISLIKQQTLRSYLAALHQDGVVYVQEVPRDTARAVQRTMYLWFFDELRYKAKILEDTYKAMARCLQRAKWEGDKVKATVEKANRSDVVGREEQFLTVQEREALEKWRAVEERIWGEVGRTSTTITATIYDTTSTITVPQVTAFATVTNTAANIQERQTMGLIPRESILAAISENAPIASSAFSACSCLSLSSSTVEARLTVQTTRIIHGFDYEGTVTTTVTQGTTTMTETVARLPSQGAMINGTTKPMGAEVYPTRTGSLNITVLPTATAIGPGFPRSNTTSIPTTLPSGSILPTGTPIASPNVTVPATTPSFPHPSPLAPSAISPSTNTAPSVPTTTSSLPLTLGNCPNINNTVITTTNSYQYQIQCYRDYDGSSFLGLQEPDLNACIGMCDAVNQAGEGMNCYGVSWRPEVDVGQAVRCDLKGEEGVEQSTSNEYAVSAVLMTGVSAPAVGT